MSEATLPHEMPAVYEPSVNVISTTASRGGRGRGVMVVGELGHREHQSSAEEPYSLSLDLLNAGTRKI